MATSKFVLAVTVNTNAATVAASIAPNTGTNSHTTGADAWSCIDNICKFLQQEVLGRGASVVYFDTAVAASTTGTFTGAPTAEDTVTVNGVAFTAKSSGATGNQFNIGSTPTLTAANLAAAINASTTAGVAGTVFASSSAGVVTFYSAVPGTAGKSIVLSESADNFTLADTTLSTGGTQSHSTVISAGATQAV